MRDLSENARPPTASAEDRRTICDEFWEQVADLGQFRQLFEHLPDVYFFVKDRNSRLMSASRQILDRFGLSEEDEIIGTSDYDFFPAHIADRFVEDDQMVMNSNQPLIHRVEIWYTDQHLLDWFVTNKLPIHDRNGEVIGVMGTVSNYQGSHRSLSSFDQIDKAVDYIRNNLRDRISVASLAKHVNLSTRQLHRRFLSVFGMSVQTFLLRSRIQASIDALIHSELSISEIAHRFCFCDQSAFTQQFRKSTGMTPLRFRRKHKRQATT